MVTTKKVAKAAAIGALKVGKTAASRIADATQEHSPQAYSAKGSFRVSRRAWIGVALVIGAFLTPRIGFLPDIMWQIPVVSSVALSGPLLARRVYEQHFQTRRALSDVGDLRTLIRETAWVAVQTPSDDDSDIAPEPTYRLAPFVRRGLVLPTGLAALVTAAAFMLGLLGWPVGPEIVTFHVWLVPITVTITTLAFVATAAAFASYLTTFGILAKRYAAHIVETETERTALAKWLAVVCGPGVTAEDLDKPDTIDTSVPGHLIVKVPPRVFTRTPRQIEDALRGVAPEWVAVDSDPSDGTLAFRLATEEERVQRQVAFYAPDLLTGRYYVQTPTDSEAQAAASDGGGMGTAVDGGGSSQSSSPAAARHPEYVFELLPSVAASRTEDIGAAITEMALDEVVGLTPEHTLLEVSRERHAIRVGALDAVTRDIRDRLAAHMGKDPREIELTAQTSDVEGTETVTEVVVLRPHGGGIEDPQKRENLWLTRMQSLVDLPDSWDWYLADETAESGRLVLRATVDPLLNGASYPWDEPVDYKHIPFAIDAHGEPVTLGLIEVNALVGGTPGSGKSGSATCLLAGISRLKHVALVGLDPKRVELSLWAPRFTRIAKTEEYATALLQSLTEVMEARYQWLESQGLKKVTANMLSDELPLIVLFIDELADLVSVGVTKEAKAAEAERSTMIRRIIAKGRAAGISVIAATQKPQADVVPTALRDLIQLRVGHATTNDAMTDTILGAGMAQNGALCHLIPANMQGTCYIVNEASRVPRRARAYWIPDEDVAGIAESVAHLRVEIPELPPEPSKNAIKSASSTQTKTRSASRARLHDLVDADE